MPAVTIVEVNRDPELITLKAVECIRAAALLLYEEDVPSAVVAERSETCRLIRCTWTKEITPTLAAQLKNSLRREEPIVALTLNSGSAGLCSRHLSSLLEQGIAVTVVPSVSSDISVPCGAGIPVTRRNAAESFCVIDLSLAQDDWKNILRLAAESTATIIVRNGAGYVDGVSKIVSNVRSEIEPVAFIRHQPRRKSLTDITTVSAMKNYIDNLKVNRDTLIVIGKVIEEVLLQPRHPLLPEPRLSRVNVGTI